MRSIININPVSYLILASLLLAGCAGTSQPSRFYLLSTLPEHETLPETERSGSLALSIGPVKLPGYLDRPQIVARTDAHEVLIAEFERWAEPLNSNFSRVLAENLSQLLDTNQIALDGWQRSLEVDYQVIVEVLRFDVSKSGKVVLRALWALAEDEGQKILTVRKFSIEIPVEASDAYAPVVSAQSQALGHLSRDIAQAIAQMENRKQFD